MANHSRPLALAATDRQDIERLQRSPATAAGLTRRARAVLLMADNMPGIEIARLTGYTPVQVSRIRRRYAEEGFRGLLDKPRSGRPPRLTEAKSARIVALTLKPPPAGLTHWSTRELAQRVGLSHTTVHRIWRAHALQPHRLQTFKFSTDPRAGQKIRDVVGLYLNPPTHAVVLSLDEETQIQALDRTRPLLPSRPRLPAHQTHDYRRHGLTSLYAALETASGRVLGECSDRHTGTDFLRFLKRLGRRYRGHELHVVLDNSSAHFTPDVRAWLDDHPSIHFHFTPTGASWLNMIEAWFGILTRTSVRRGSFPSVSALARHIRHHIDHWNENPTPFVWTKKSADIIRKAAHRNR
jgi:transposase